MYCRTANSPQCMGDGSCLPHTSSVSKADSFSSRRSHGVRSLKVLVLCLSLLLILECTYCLAVFTDLTPLSELRDLYIETALGTMNHKWLATALIPGDIVQTVYEEMEAARKAQIGQNSSDWELESAGSIFSELDEAELRAWAEAHPETIENGWDDFYVNQAGLNDAGLELYTKLGDQVLAIDAANGLLVVRIREEKFRGVLVFAKDPSRLSCAAAEQWGVAGQTAGEIAANHGALVALTASGFNDSAPEGAEQTGAAMCGGRVYGSHLREGYKRLEKRSDNKLYVVDAPGEFHPDCTDAAEWTPALIVDGEVVVTKEDHYNARNPRSCLGQRADGTVLMLCIEGRYFDSLGATAPECAEILARYGAVQAMNLDGGTSAILWYQGEYITRCSDPDRPEGRLLPNAWIYK
ncbi:MAG: phosphodiester glycosidase family protein [Oscillospiraceae bacterium]|nr:phosphodiester glycosidase family protein [Oscillospiraceae bacterium]